MVSFVATSVRVRAGGALARLLSVVPAALLFGALFTVWAGPLAAPVSATTGSDWAQFQNGPTHEGYDAAETILSSSSVAGLGVSWTGSVGAVTSSPAVAAGVVYVGSSDGTLFAYGVGCATGGAACTPLWKAQTAGLIESTPAVVNGVVYVGTIAGNLYAFDAAGVIGCGGSPKTCTPLWVSKAGADIAAPPTVTGGVVYVGSGYYLYAFDAAGVSGCTAGMGPRICDPLWMGRTGGSIESSPAVSGGVVYVGSGDGNLYAFDATGVSGCSGAPKTCSPLWTANAGDSLYYPIVSSPAVANGMVYIGSYNGKLYAFDATGVTGCSGSPKTCSPLWTGATGGNIDSSSPAVANGVVYIGSHDQKLYAFGTGCNSGGRTCSPLWTADTGAGIDSSPAVANGLVYVGSDNDKLRVYAVGCASGGATCTAIWTGTAGISSLAVSDGAVYVVSAAGQLYALGLPKLDHLALSPSSPTITSGASQKLSAQGFDGAGNSVGDVTASTVFTISAGGSCAGASCTATVPGDYVVTATDATVTATVTLHVTADSPDHLVLSPDRATIPAGGNQAYSAQGFDASGNSLGDVTVATSFAISGGGTCLGMACTVAGPGTYVVTGTDGSASGTVTLVVIAGLLSSLALSPSSATVNPGVFQSFTVQGFDSYGDSLGDVTAATSLAISGGGSCNPSLCYSYVTGDHTVTATNGRATGTATLTVTSGPVASLVLNASSQTITAGGSQAFTATGFDAFGNSLGDVTSATVFTIGGGGSCASAACTATVSGVHTVTATDGSASGTLALNVTPGAPSRLVVNPSGATIAAGGSQTYTSLGYDIYDNATGDVTTSTTFAISGGGSCKGATCTSTVAGTHAVTATDGNATGTATVVVTSGLVTRLVLSPSIATITAGVNQAYTATAFDAYGNSIGDVSAWTTFRISGLGLCTGVWCGPTTVGTYAVTGTYGGVTAGATLQVTPGPLAYLSLSPSGATVTVGGSQAYTAAGFDDYGNSIGDITASTTFAMSGGSCSASTCTANTIAGNRDVVATYGSFSSQVPIYVKPGPIAYLELSSPLGTAMTAGVAQAFSATGMDAYGNPVGDVTSTTAFAISGGLCTGPSCVSSVAGISAVTGTYGSATGTMRVVVSAGSLDHLSLNPSGATIAAGGSQTYTSLGDDIYGNATGDVTTSTTFAISGGGSCKGATCTSTVAGTHTVTATDGNATGTATVVATPGLATTFTVSGLASPFAAGSTHSVKVTALDAFGNVATGYRGTAHFTSSDSKAVLPADYTFTATDAGIHNFSLTLKTAGTESVTATDKVTSTITGAQAGITVTPGAAKTLAVSGLPNPYSVGSSRTVTVTALDAYGNVATGYLGKIHFTSSDSKAALPADYTFTSTDAGIHNFSVTLKTTGTRSVTAADKTTSTIAGSQTVVVATPGLATTFTVSGLASSFAAGSTHSVKVTALDAFGNVATGYRGTAHFTSSDSKAVLPADYTFTATDAGIHNFSLTLKTAGTESVTATDKVTSTITGAQAGITVTPGAAKTLAVSGLPNPYSVGSSRTVTVTALDAYGNVATGYLGKIHFTSSDSKAALPADYTFTSTDAGIHNFSVTLKTTGTRSVTAADKTTSTIAGSQTGIVVR
jgi:outer membrane protein assembly factor BamB